MELSGKQIIKKAKKMPKWIIIGYIICITAIIGSIYWMNYRIENETPEPIDFTTDGAVGMEAGKYAYLEAEGLTDAIAVYGDEDDKQNSNNDRYYMVFSEKYMYIVNLDFDTVELLKPLNEYLYSANEDTEAPESIKIYGITESIPNELRQIILNYYNEGLEEEYQILDTDFENYFGSALLNVRREPVDTIGQEITIGIAVLVIVLIGIVHIVITVEKNRVKKYLKKNKYNEELENQLDNFAEEKHYNDKVILTRDFLIDLKYGGFVAFKYSDIKWIYIHEIKTYGVTTSSNLIVYLKDGKTKVSCVEISGTPTDEFKGILNKICEKAPANSLKEFSPENKKIFKEYKKQLKND